MAARDTLDMVKGCPNGLSYFNGTPCPIISNNKIPFESIGMDIIKEGLKCKISLNELKDIHLKQMQDMESSLSNICKKDKGLTTKKNIKKWLKENNASEPQVEMLWYTNVYILLKLKVIKNDNMNGMIFCS